MRTRVFACALALSALALTLTGCGTDSAETVAGDDGVVEVTMLDTRFEPDQIRVDAGQTVTFQFRNDGALPHEAFIGDVLEQDAHEEEMSPPTGESPHGMGGDMPSKPRHDGTDALRLEPGARGSLEYRFEQPGTILIGCHEPGHWEAGMRADIEVV